MMTSRSASKKRSRSPSDPFAKLTPSSLAQFARLLRLPPPKEGLGISAEWLEYQRETVAALPFELQRQLTLANFLRIPKGLVLCPAHRGINEALVMWCFDMLKEECSTRVRNIIAYRRAYRTECKVVVREFLDRIIGIQALYMPKFNEYYYVPPHCHLEALGSGCPACVLSVVGGRRALLVALRANMMARRRAKLPRLLTLVDAWIAARGPEEARTLETLSNGLANELLLARVKMGEHRTSKLAGESPEKNEARVGREKSRGKVKSSSHRGGEPAGVKRDEDGTALPPFKLGPNPEEHIDPSEVDTLFQRLEADVMVPAGVNPEVMSAAGEGGYNGNHPATGVPRPEYTASVLAQGYDGRGGFCNGYGMRRATQVVREDFKEATARQQDDTPELENASAIPEPLNLRFSTLKAQPTSRHAPPGTRPGTPGSHVTSFVPARRTWKAATMSQVDIEGDVNAGGRAHPAYDVSDLSDKDNDNTYGEEYSSEVETEFATPAALRQDSALPAAYAEAISAAEVLPNNPTPVAGPSTSAPATRPTRKSSAQCKHGNHRSAHADPRLDHPPMSSIYSDTPRVPPSSVGPPRMHFENPFADPGAYQRGAGPATSRRHSGGSVAPSQLPRMHTPEDYAEGVAEVAEFFGMEHVGPHDDVETVVPDDSVSVVHERAALASLETEMQRVRAQQAEQAERVRQQAWTRPEPRPTQRRSQGQGSNDACRQSDAETEWAGFLRGPR